MSWYIKVLENYATFSGRARRKEYWMFLACNMSVAFCIGIVVGVLKLPSFVGQFYNLAVFIPSLAVGVRRMHDCNYSGWYLLVPVLNLMLLFREGDGIANRFGEPTKPPEGNPYVEQNSEPQKKSA